MYICYRDELGMIKVEVDGSVFFMEGKAYFSSDSRDYEVPADTIMEIGQGW